MSSERDRSRERLPPREGAHRPPPSISTNSDNPKLLNSRVFIGNLPTDRVTRDDLEEIFGKYGKIAGLSVHKGFAFVQYLEERDALVAVTETTGTRVKGSFIGMSIHKGFGFVQFLDEASGLEAVKSENMSTIKGYKVDVKMAAEGRKSAPPPPRMGDRDGRMGERDGRMGERDGRMGERDGRMGDRDGRMGERDGRPPMRYGGSQYDHDDDDDLPSRDMIHKGGRPDPYERDSYDRYPRDRSPPPRGPPGRERSPVRRDPYDDRWGRERREDPYARERRDPYDEPYRRPGEDPYDKREPRDPPYRREPEPYGRESFRERERDHKEPPRAAECEIIGVGKQLRGYAEMIERRLKDRVSTQVDIPPEGISVAAAVEDCSRRGMLYAVVVNSQNEAHRSCTVNILHGQPQEHRNMPFEEALNLISRNLQEYLAALRSKKTPPGGAPSRSEPAPVFLPPDSETVYLLNLLADNRQLTLAELDKVIGYLNQRRSRLLSQPAAPSPKPAAPKPQSQSQPGGPPSQGLLETPTSMMGNPASMRDEKAIIEQQAELQAKILNILNGSGGGNERGSPNPAGMGGAPGHPGKRPSGLAALQDSYGGMQQAPQQASPSINLDNPNIQMALDNLIQSGPNLLKNIAPGGTPPGKSYPQQPGGGGGGAALLMTPGGGGMDQSPYGNGRPNNRGGGYPPQHNKPPGPGGFGNNGQAAQNQGYGGPAARMPNQGLRPQGGMPPQHGQPRFPAYGRPY